MKLKKRIGANYRRYEGCDGTDDFKTSRDSPAPSCVLLLCSPSPVSRPPARPFGGGGSLSSVLPVSLSSTNQQKGANKRGQTCRLRARAQETSVSRISLLQARPASCWPSQNGRSPDDLSRT